MPRQVFLILDEDERCLGTVDDILELADAGAEKHGLSERDVFRRSQWGPALELANVLGWIVEDLLCEADDSRQITVEIR